MKVVILAGGRGTRLGGDQPKPMVEIGGIPMLSHIIKVFQKHGYNDFVIATGYKGSVISDYYEHDLSFDCLDTGLDTNTGERVAQCADYLKGEPFLLTYGDGLADININKLVDFHFKVGSAVTVTAVHPPARFGQLVLSGHDVVAFNEKPENQTEWINGGFFVVSGDFPRLKSWEFEILPYLAEHDDLTAYRHAGFWHCMDTQRDVDALNQLWKDGAPWL